MYGWDLDTLLSLDINEWVINTSLDLSLDTVRLLT